MKILHAPINVAGQPTEISRAERRLGYQSDVLILNDDNFNYEFDINLELSKEKNRFKRVWKILSNFLYCLKTYDVFHFHYMRTLLPKFIDLTILRIFGKKIVMQYWGTDIIQFDIASTRMLYKKEEFAKVFHPQDDNKKRAQIARMEKMVNATVVGDPELLPFSPKSKVILKALNLDKFEFIGVETDKHKLKIVHAPSNRGVKGTDKIIEVMDSLKKFGLDFEFILVEGKSNQEAKEIYKSADLIIDDIMQGPYGILCMEAMALGKPVMCHIDKSLVDSYPGLPIVNVNPDNLEDKVKEVLSDAKLREELGRNGRVYMEEHHDIMKTAKKFIDLYYSL